MKIIRSYYNFRGNFEVEFEDFCIAEKHSDTKQFWLKEDPLYDSTAQYVLKNWDKIYSLFLSEKLKENL